MMAMLLLLVTIQIAVALQNRYKAMSIVLPKPLMDHITAIYDDKLYVFGGRSSSNIYNRDFYRIDLGGKLFLNGNDDISSILQQSDWESLSVIPPTYGDSIINEFLCEHQCSVLIDDYLYIVGAYSSLSPLGSNTRTNLVYRLDLSKDPPQFASQGDFKSTTGYLTPANRMCVTTANSYMFTTNGFISNANNPPYSPEIVQYIPIPNDTQLNLQNMAAINRCSCDHLSWKLEYVSMECPADKCGGCLSNGTCNYNTNCYTYKVTAKQPESYNNPKCQYSGPSYIMIPPKNDCPVWMHQWEYWNVLEKVTDINDADLRWEEIYDRGPPPDQLTNISGVKIPINISELNTFGSFSFKICLFGVTHFLGPGNLTVGWGYNDSYVFGHTCPSLVKLPDLCEKYIAHRRRRLLSSTEPKIEPGRRNAGCASNLNETKIYLFGGKTIDNVYGAPGVDYYDITSNKWTDNSQISQWDIDNGARYESRSFIKCFGSLYKDTIECPGGYGIVNSIPDISPNSLIWDISNSSQQSVALYTGVASYGLENYEIFNDGYNAASVALIIGGATNIGITATDIIQYAVRYGTPLHKPPSTSPSYAPSIAPTPTLAPRLYTYFKSSTPISWLTAAFLCIEHGTSLATFITGNDYTNLMNVIGQNRAYIGLNDRGTENTWTWIDGIQCETGHATLCIGEWKIGEPNGSGDCSEMSGGLVDDLLCDAAYHWINGYVCNGVLPSDQRTQPGKTEAIQFDFGQDLHPNYYNYKLIIFVIICMILCICNVWLCHINWRKRSVNKYRIISSADYTTDDSEA